MRRVYSAELPIGSPRCGHQTCGQVFANPGLFDKHVAGVVNGKCPDPAEMGLEARDGVWGTPEGNARAEVLLEQLTARRRAPRKGSRGSSHRGAA